MDNGVLYPPNHKFLSDDVIGSVVQSRRPSSSIAAVEGDVEGSSHRRHEHRRRYPYSDHALENDTKKAHIGDDRELATRKSADFLPLTRQQPQRHDILHAEATRRTTKPGSTTSHDNQLAVTMKQVISKKDRLRALRRERQIRYRKKKHVYMLSLEAKNRKLQEEIEQLQQRKRDVSAMVPAKLNLWNVVVEYFRLFRYGFQARVQGSTRAPQSASQLSFLRYSMAPDAAFNAEWGVDAILKSWRCISMWFEDTELELEELKKDSDEYIVTVTTISFTISERTIANVFPHLIGRADEGLGWFATQLLGRQVVMRGLTRFEWDRSRRRVSSVIAQSDLLTPMLHLLGSLESVSRVFEEALISFDFRWRSRESHGNL